MSAIEDGLSHPEVVALSHLGTSGTHPQNTFRDMTRLYNLENSIMPVHYLAWIPMLDTSVMPHVVKFIHMPFMLCHRLLGCMSEYFKNEFKRLLGRGLVNYWDQMDVDRDPRFARSVIKDRRGKGYYQCQKTPTISDVVDGSAMGLVDMGAPSHLLRQSHTYRAFGRSPESLVGVALS
jgi:hypothetical protein